VLLEGWLHVVRNISWEHSLSSFLLMSLCLWVERLYMPWILLPSGISFPEYDCTSLFRTSNTADHGIP
jgi:hypothetical protein